MTASGLARDMPLRIRKPHLQLSLPSINTPTSHCQCAQNFTSRPFSTTPHHARKTLLRQEMYDWLNGPGAVFKEPRPGSTNYLNAYDKEGHLLRTKKELQPPASSGDEDVLKFEDEDNEESGSLKKDNARGPVPPETPDDLMPFPHNRQFRSQPVLSEELKDEIWRQVVDLKKSVRAVSMDLNVEMSRVGAVVRLKAVEKQWVQQVRRFLLQFLVGLMAFYVMRNPSIGLKDKITGYQIYYNSLIIPAPIPFPHKVSTSLSHN